MDLSDAISLEEAYRGGSAPFMKRGFVLRGVFGGVLSRGVLFTPGVAPLG